MGLKDILEQPGLILLDAGAIGYFKGSRNINDMLREVVAFSLSGISLEDIKKEKDSISAWCRRMEEHELFSISSCSQELTNYESRIRNCTGILYRNLSVIRRTRNAKTYGIKMDDTLLEALSGLADAINHAAWIFKKRCLLTAFSNEQKAMYKCYLQGINEMLVDYTASNEDADISETDKMLVAAALVSATEEPTRILTADHHIAQIVRGTAKHCRSSQNLQLPQYPVHVYQPINEVWTLKADSFLYNKGHP